MAIETSAGYLTLEKAAAELETTPLAVKRLIARDRINAVQLGAGGKWRIAGIELGRFIGNGAPDLKMPRMARGWFDPDNPYTGADVFLRKFIKAASEQLADPPPAEDRVAIPVTAAMYAVATAPAARHLGSRKAAPAYVDALHAYCVDQIRSITKSLLYKSGDKLAELYKSPDRYAQLTTAAMAVLLKKNIEFSRPRPAGGSITYFIMLMVLLDRARQTQTLQAAF